MGFVFIHRLAPFVAHPPGFGIVLDAGGRKQRRVHQRAASYHDAAGIELPRDRLEQHPVQIQADQDASETYGGRALRRGFVCDLVAGSGGPYGIGVGSHSWFPTAVRGSHLAVQGQRRPPSPHSKAATSGDQLGSLRCRPAPARQPHSLVHRRGDRGLEGRAANHPRRPATLLGPGHHHGADAASGVPPGPAPDRRADRLHPRPARLGSGSAGPLDTEPKGRDAGGVTAAARRWSRAPAGGQHRAEAVRRGRVADREAWDAHTPVLAQAAPRRGRRHWADPCRGAHHQRRR